MLVVFAALVLGCSLKRWSCHISATNSQSQAQFRQLLITPKLCRELSHLHLHISHLDTLSSDLQKATVGLNYRMASGSACSLRVLTGRPLKLSVGGAGHGRFWIMLHLSRLLTCHRPYLLRRLPGASHPGCSPSVASLHISCTNHARKSRPDPASRHFWAQQVPVLISRK